MALPPEQVPPNKPADPQGSAPPVVPSGRPHDDLLPRRRPVRSLAKRIGFLAGGSMLIVVGIALGPLPVVPGWPLVVVGLVVLSMADERVRKLINRGDRKLPHRAQHGLRWARNKGGLAKRPRSSPPSAGDADRPPGDAMP